MIGTVLLYFLKIGIPAFLIGYTAKVKYQEKYVESVTDYLDRIKKQDTELMIKDLELARSDARTEALLREVVQLRTNLGLEIDMYYDEDFQKNLGQELL